MAKTLLIRTLARCLSLDFNRVQFTPDLMPSDITGTDVMYDDKTTGQREFKFLHGPLFANVAPGRRDQPHAAQDPGRAAGSDAGTPGQSAGGKRHGLPDPFFVLATQNPIEQEGTYPLPEAQLDRFLLKIYVGYPTEAEERQIYRLTTSDARRPSRPPVLGGDELIALQKVVRRVPISDLCVDYIARLVRARPARPTPPPRRSSATGSAGASAPAAASRSSWPAVPAPPSTAAPRSTSTTSRRWSPPSCGTGSS